MKSGEEDSHGAREGFRAHVIGRLTAHALEHDTMGVFVVSEEASNDPLAESLMTLVTLCRNASSIMYNDAMQVHHSWIRTGHCLCIHDVTTFFWSKVWRCLLPCSLKV